MIRDLLHVTERSDVLSLAGGLPAAEMLPTDRLAIAMDRALRRNGAYGPDALQYGATEGVAELRAAIARSAARMDGRTRADDVLVTTGSQQALDLVARTTIDPGDTVVMERPAYLGALQTFAGVGARVVTVVSDAEGLRTDELERHLRGGLRPKLCTIVPNFQNPSGATMPTERRAHLASLAERYGFLIVEDDPYRELRFDGDSLPPLRAHTDLAIGLGSSSKILAPGLRVGWIAAPSPLVDALTRTKQRVDLHTPTLNQLVVLDVLRDVAFLNAHIARLRVCYAARRDALLTALRHHLAGRVEVDRPDGGFFLWARLPGTDTEALLPSAVAAGVAFVPGAAFTTDGSGADRMRLSFASLAPAQLADAAARLATVVAAGEPPLPAARPLLGSPNTYHQAPSAKGASARGTG